VIALGAASLALASFPATAPTDPLHAPAQCPPMSSCNGPTAQWNLLSFNDNVPTTTGASGISTDLAWQVTTGRSDITIAVLVLPRASRRPVGSRLVSPSSRRRTRRAADSGRRVRVLRNFVDAGHSGEGGEPRKTHQTT